MSSTTFPLMCPPLPVARLVRLGYEAQAPTVRRQAGPLDALELLWLAFYAFASGEIRELLELPAAMLWGGLKWAERFHKRLDAAEKLYAEGPLSWDESMAWARKEVRQ